MFDYSCSRRQFLGLAGGIAAMAGLGLAGCGNSAAPASTGSAAGSAAAKDIAGEVTYDGASSFQALVEAAAEKFMDKYPDVIISGSGNGSGKGLTAVAAGTVTIGNSDVFAETKLEEDDVKNLVDHEVAVVGMGPVVSKNVKVDDLSLEQLKGIFSGAITNWKEVGGDDATIVVLNRLKRIEGQVRGLQAMIERDAYCYDILTQSAAVNAAIYAFNKEILAHHIEGCVARDIREGKDEVIGELVSIMQKLMK